MEWNPYAPTTSIPHDANITAPTEIEAIRRQHLGTEASIQSVGLLYWIGAVLLIVYGFIAIAGGLTLATRSPLRIGASEFAIIIIIASVALCFGGMQAYAAQSLRKLNPKGKGLAILLTCFGLLGFPVGTLISGYILYLLLSEKGQFVFSPEYRAIIDATPHIRYKTSLLAWMVLIVFVLLILGMVVALVGIA